MIKKEFTPKFRTDIEPDTFKSEFHAIKEAKRLVLGVRKHLGYEKVDDNIKFFKQAYDDPNIYTGANAISAVTLSMVDDKEGAINLIRNIENVIGVDELDDSILLPKIGLIRVAEIDGVVVKNPDISDTVRFPYHTYDAAALGIAYFMIDEKEKSARVLAGIENKVVFHDFSSHERLYKEVVGTSDDKKSDGFFSADNLLISLLFYVNERLGDARRILNGVEKHISFRKPWCGHEMIRTGMVMNSHVGPASPFPTTEDNALLAINYFMTGRKGEGDNLIHAIDKRIGKDKFKDGTCLVRDSTRDNSHYTTSNMALAAAYIVRETFDKQ